MQRDMVRRLGLLVFLTLGLAWVMPGGAVIRYVNVGGSGGSDCSAGTNISTPLSSINNGLRCLGGAGDVLYLRGNTYTENIPQNTYPSGTSWATIAPGGTVVWIGAYSPSPGTWEAVTIQANTGGADQSVVSMIGANYVVFDHLHTHANNPSNASEFVAVRASSYAVLYQRGEITLTQGPCITPYTANANIVVINTDTTAGAGGGPWFRQNYIHDNPCQYSFYIQRHSNNILIEDNEIANMGPYGLQLYTGCDSGETPPCYHFLNITIRNNLFRNNGKGINPDTGTPFGSAAAIVANEVNNLQIYNNVFIDNRGTIFMNDDINVKIYNNTIYNNDNTAYAALIWGNSRMSNVELRNNLAYQNTNGGTLGSMDGAAFTETHTANGIDPQFQNAGARDLHLTASTPTSIRDGGLCLTAVPTDKDGNTRPNSGSTLCDVGAYEYGGTVANIPTPTNLHFTTLP